MSILTNWGYELTEVDSIPAIMTVAEFNTLTANRFSGDIRIDKTIASVESSIRNYVGWHLAGNLKSKVSYLVNDNHIIRKGSDMLVQLPSRYITKIISVAINGESFEDFTLKSNGTLILFDVYCFNKRSTIDIVFDSGLSDDMLDGIKELISNRVSRGLSQTNGVQSETTGGVSITYSSSWSASTGAGALCDDNREVLMAYKLTEVF